MEKDKFTDSIKDKINAYESPMNVNSGWESLKQRKTKDKRIVYLMSLLLLVVGTIAFVALKITPQNTPITPKILTESNQNIIFSENNAQKSVSVSEQQAQVPPPQYLDKKGNNEGLSETKIRTTNEKRQATIPLNAVYNNAENKDNINAVGTKNIISEADNITNVEVKDNTNNTATAVNATSKADNVTNIVEKDNINAAKIMLSDFSFLPSISTGLLTSNSHLDKQKPLFSINTNLRKNKNKQRDIYVNTGIGSTEQLFKAKDTAAIALQNLRNKQEKGIETYITTIGVNQYVTPKTYISLSLNYAHGFNRFDYTQVAQHDTMLKNVLVRIITYQPQGNKDEIKGDTIVKQRTYTTGRYYQTYKTLDVNLGFGYTLIDNKRINLSVSSGASWNIMANSKGKVATQSLNTALADIAQGNIYKKTFGFGAFVGVSAQYKLNSKVAFTVNPNFSYGLSNILQNDNVLTSHTYRYGLLLGIKYTFNAP